VRSSHGILAKTAMDGGLIVPLFFTNNCALINKNHTILLLGGNNPDVIFLLLRSSGRIISLFMLNFLDQNIMLHGRIIHRKQAFLLVILFAGIIAIFSISFFNLNNPPIRSDGVGYYLYLPAAFIYHDIGLQRIAVEEFNGHIPEWTGAKPYPGTQNYLIKYPMGEAILLSPFFFFAWLLSYLFNVKIDGFSYIFQFAAAISGLIYTTAGLSILWDVLRKNFETKTIQLVMFGIVFGTNLFHYATYDSIFSHAYSFFLFCAFLYLVDRLYSRSSMRDFIAAGAVAGVIILTRPTNGVWLLFGVFYGITSSNSFFERFQFIKRHGREILIGLLPLLGFIAIQLIYWKTITGKFFICPYDTEYFNFLKPEIINVLFSARKGLFFWSPILLTIFPGLYFLKKKAPEYLVPALLFLAINTCIISSWYMWWYGGSFGSRPFVESLPLFAICLCSLYEGVSSVIGKRLLTAFIFLCAALSIFLMFKYWLGDIPFDGINWDSFLNKIIPFNK
jgi:hypothetical protein